MLSKRSLANNSPAEHQVKTVKILHFCCESYLYAQICHLSICYLSAVNLLFVTCQFVICHLSICYLSSVNLLFVTCQFVICHVSFCQQPLPDVTIVLDKPVQFH